MLPTYVLLELDFANGKKKEAITTVWKVSKYGFFSGLYFVFGLNTEIYGVEKTPYLDTFHAVYAYAGFKFCYFDYDLCNWT